MIVVGASGCGASAGSAAMNTTAPPYDREASSRAQCVFGPTAVTTATVGPDVPHGTQLSMVQNVVVMMMENRSFDHYFSQLPQAGVTDVDVASSSVTNFDPRTNTDVPRYHEQRYCVGDIDHEWTAVHVQYDAGKLDGFADSGGRAAMGYYDKTDLKFYYWLAASYAISDRHFSSLLGPTMANRLFSFKATSCGFGDGPETEPAAYECGKDGTNILGLAGGVTRNGRTGAVIYSDAPWRVDASGVGLGVYHDVPKSIGDFEQAVAADALPLLSIVEPNYGHITSSSEDDEHPPTDIQLGQALVYRVISALRASPAWQHSVLFLTYDEHGGFYDHVPPPSACPPDNSRVYDFPFNRLGIRVPLIVVSPFAKKAYVSHIVSDHTSILRFIENWLDLPAMTARDANAWPLLDMFDFENAPVDPAFPDSSFAAVDTSADRGCVGGTP